MASGQRATAAALVKSALSQSDDPALLSAAQVILSHTVPQWHRLMLRDAERNMAFERAIARSLHRGGTVLDIGAGSGLLSLMAARAGAAVVYACEADAALAATAQEIVELNGYSETVRVLPKRSTDLDRDSDLAGGADVIVGEVFSDDVIGEGALATLEHAAGALGKRDVQIIPAAASIQVALAYREPNPSSLSDVRGFDLSPFEKHFWPARKVKADDPRLSLRSEARTLFHFDFQSGGPFGAGQVHMTLTACGGPANGVVRWIRLQLDEEVQYENKPGPETHSHWSPLFWPFPGNALEEGESVELHADHNRELVTLWVV